MRISKPWYGGIWILAFTCSLAIAAEPKQADHEAGRFTEVKAWGQSLSNVVAVVDDAILSHTTQLFPTNKEGKVVGGTSLPAQLEQTLKNLEIALRRAGSSIDEVVKLNIYAATPEVAASLQTEFTKAWTGENRPAIALVVTPLHVDGALVAMDAVSEAGKAKFRSRPGAANKWLYIQSAKVEALGSGKRALHVSNLLRGDVLYVSGQAIPGDTIHAAAKATFEGLFKTLKHYEVSPDAIVQFKVFLDPVTKANEVEQALVELLPEGDLPPLVFVQWESPGSVEIELIAAAPAADDIPPGETISFLTPPWMSSSPNFCRVTRVHGSRRVYFPGLMASKSGDGTAQIRDVFDSLGKVGKQLGTGYEHLAKATYYVSDQDASGQLNKLRPDYYNPKRPPAASKAAVKHVGFPGRSFMMDMIAVVPEGK